MQMILYRLFKSLNWCEILNKINQTLVKFCGIRTKQDIKTCQYSDYLGFIVDVPNAKRNLDYEVAKDLIEFGKKFTTTVAITTSVEKVSKINEIIKPDIIQIHTKLSLNLDKLKTKLDSIKQAYALVIGLEDEKIINEDILKHPIGINAEYIVIEHSKNGKIKGGSGESRDWTNTKDIIRKHSKIRFFVAGGINPKNALEVITLTKPTGIDISSGIENPDGTKSSIFVREILKHTKN